MIINSSSNFREIAIGQIPPGILYRSNHPVSNNKQVKEIVLAANTARIKTIINLSDSDESLRAGIIHCPWYKKLYDEGSVIAVNMDMRIDVMEPMTLRKIKQAIVFMAEHEAPYFIHCVAGIDRTGFLSVLLESLMGSPLDEMARDYMLSFVDASEYSKSDYRNGVIFLSNLFSKIKEERFDLNDDPALLTLRYLTGEARVKEEVLKILKVKLAGKGL